MLDRLLAIIKYVNTIIGWPGWTIILFFLSLPVVWGPVRMPRLVFGKATDETGEDFLVWWHIPVSINPRFWQRYELNNCSVHLVVMESGQIISEFPMCWQTSKGPELVINLERTKRYLIPIAIRSIKGNTYEVFVDKHRKITFQLPSHSPIFTTSDVILEDKTKIDLINKDCIIRLHIRRKGRVIKRSRYCVLSVPPATWDNRQFHLRN